MPMQSSNQLASHSAERCPDLSGVNALVVDDDADARALTTFLLKQYGATVTAVASAEEAFTAVTQLKPDVLISDIGMPTVDGYLLIRQVRALPLD